MLEFIEPDEVGNIYRRSVQSKLIDEQDTATIFYSRKQLHDRLRHLENVFGNNVKHSVAIKTHNTSQVLKEIIGLGFGLEAASLEEVKWALACGLNPEKIVFDSPAKTTAEIKWCEQNCKGMITNANCLDELERYADNTPLRLGLRINPEVSVDAPGIFNVSLVGSKFGEPLSNREKIMEAAVSYPRLEGLHVHAGSDINNFSGSVEGIKRIFDLAKDIDRQRAANNLPPLSYIDIGGGVVAEFSESGQGIGLERYGKAIKSAVPELFDNYEVLTEFGRFVHAHNAFVISKVEYVLPAPRHGSPTAILHVGADMFLRRVYADADAPHRLLVLDHSGHLKPQVQTQSYHLAGPLCFAGDYLYHSADLPVMEPGDNVAILDVGANTTSMWSRHCSRDLPKVLLYDQDEGHIVIAHNRTPVQLL